MFLICQPIVFLFDLELCKTLVFVLFLPHFVFSYWKFSFRLYLHFECFAFSYHCLCFVKELILVLFIFDFFLEFLCFCRMLVYSFWYPCFLNVVPNRNVSCKAVWSVLTWNNWSLTTPERSATRLRHWGLDSGHSSRTTSGKRLLKLSYR